MTQDRGKGDAESARGRPGPGAAASDSGHLRLEGIRAGYTRRYAPDKQDRRTNAKPNTYVIHGAAVSLPRPLAVLCFDLRDSENVLVQRRRRRGPLRCSHHRTQWSIRKALRRSGLGARTATHVERDANRTIIGASCAALVPQWLEIKKSTSSRDPRWTTPQGIPPRKMTRECDESRGQEKDHQTR